MPREYTLINETDKVSSLSFDEAQANAGDLGILPTELLPAVFNHLDVRSLRRLANTCRFFGLQRFNKDLINEAWSRCKIQIWSNCGTTFLLTPKGLWGWGVNYAGKLGLGDAQDRHTPTQIALDQLDLRVEDIKDAFILDGYSIMLTSKGIYTCGDNSYGQLGLSHDENRNVFTPIDLTLLSLEIGDIKKVIAGGYGHIILVTTKGIYVCGSNNSGQLGLGDNDNRNAFTQLNLAQLNLELSDIQQVIVKNNYTILVTTKGIYTCGDNSEGQLGLGHNENRNVFTPIDLTLLNVDLNDIQQVIASAKCMILLTSKGIFTCGWNDWGQLGLEDNINKNTLTPINLAHLGLVRDDVEKIIQHRYSYSTTLVTTKGIYTCGYNSTGHLGLGNFDDINTFTPINLAHLELDINDIKAVITEGLVSTLVTTKGIYVCGSNNSGQLGLGDNAHRNIFTRINLTQLNLELIDIQQVIVQDSYTILVTTKGLYTCGVNRLGQLGLGDNDKRSSFTLNEHLPHTIDHPFISPNTLKR